MTFSTRFLWRSLGASVATLSLVACGGGDDATPAPTGIPSTPAPQATPLPPLPTIEEAGSVQDPLVISLVVEDPAGRETDAEELAAILSREAELSVEVILTQDPAEALAALCQGQAAAASLDALTYLTAQEAGCGELLYQAQVDGQSVQRGQIVSAADRIFTLQNVQDRVFCRTNTNSMIGWVLPALSLRVNGIDPFADLAGVLDAADDDEVLADVVDRTCDVGVTTLGAQDSLDNPEAVDVIFELVPVPHIGLMLATSLSPEHHAALQDALDASRSDLADLLEVEALVEGDDTAYNGLRELFETAGVNSLTLSH